VKIKRINGAGESGGFSIWRSAVAAAIISLSAKARRSLACEMAAPLGIAAKTEKLAWRKPAKKLIERKAIGEKYCSRNGENIMARRSSGVSSKRDILAAWQSL
jgi:hypothetical protein